MNQYGADPSGRSWNEHHNSGRIAEEDPSSPLNLIRIILYRWKWVLLGALLGALVGVLYIYVATPVFEAEATLQMSIRQPRVINNDAVIDDNDYVRDESVIFYTRVAKFKSPAMEQLVVDEYYKRYPEDKYSGSNMGISRDQLTELVQFVDWVKDPKANIVTVSFCDPNPEFAAKFVNVLTHCAEKLMLQENDAQSDKAVAWLVEKVEEEKVALVEIEQKLSQLKGELHLDSLQQRKMVLDQSLTAISTERERSVSTLGLRRVVCDYLRKLQGTVSNLEELPPGLPKEDQLKELLQTWSNAREKRMQMASRYREVHPDYLEAEKAEARLKEQLDQFIDISIRAVENEIDLLTKEIEQKDERAESLKAEAILLEREIESRLQKLERLGSERDVANSSYQAMLSRVAEARLAADENMAFTEVIRDAKVPRFPVSPRKPKAIFSGVFIGGVLASVIVLGLAFLLDTVSSVKDLRALNLSILGSIPSQKKIESRGELATVGLHDKFNHIVEMFTGINALLSSDKLSEHAKVLVVGSVMPGEGKTVCVCNLAISSALSGAKTLLVDGDLRRPQIANIFALDESQPSLSEWLKNDSNELGFQHITFPGVVDNLDIICSKPFNDENPVEFMGRDRLAVLIDWARDRYDRVIIDSPPMGMVGDAYMLMSAATSVILVSRIGKTRRRLLKHILNRFSAMDVHVLGCIANDVPHSLAGMFSGTEGYGYGYSYQYKSYKDD